MINQEINYEMIYLYSLFIAGWMADELEIIVSSSSLQKFFFKFYCYDSLGMDIWKAAILTVYLVFATFDVFFVSSLFVYIARFLPSQ